MIAKPTTVAQQRRIARNIKPSRKWDPLVQVTTAGFSTAVKECWENRLYYVTVRRFENGWPPEPHLPYCVLGIASHDGEPRHDWREFQKIKNQLAGPEWEAVELYPSELRLLDPSNYYMLWCAPKIPIGHFEGRRVCDENGCCAAQRGFHPQDRPTDIIVFDDKTQGFVDETGKPIGAKAEE